MLDIDKERAAFEAWYGAPNPLKRDSNGNYLYAEANTAWGVWLAAKKHAAEQDKWIPVSELLPNNDDKLLLLDYKGNICSGYLDGDSEAFIYAGENSWFDDGIITHWRYLHLHEEPNDKD